MSDFQTTARATPARGWAKVLTAYQAPSHWRSLAELAITAMCFAIIWLLSYKALAVGYWLSLLLAVPAGAFLVRLFLIQHDCGHGSFFRHRALNDWLGRLLGPLTLTPYDTWRQSHAIHHAGSGNLARRGIGDIRTLTVNEYLALSRWGRLGYRMYRNPLVMFGIGPSYLFLLQHRVPMGLMRYGWVPWTSTLGTNFAIALLAGAMIWMIGLWPFLAVHLPIVVCAATIGVWLFYVQHQFEDTYWAKPEEWALHEAALHGSSYYVLPAPLRWLTANIGLHQVHHLSSRIPFYRLPSVLKAHPELAEVSRITMRESLACVRLTLWDEDRQKMIGFSDLDRAQARAA